MFLNHNQFKLLKVYSRKVTKLLEIYMWIEEELLVYKRKNMTYNFFKQKGTVIKKFPAYLNCLNPKLNI